MPEPVDETFELTRCIIDCGALAIDLSSESLIVALPVANSGTADVPEIPPGVGNCETADVPEIPLGVGTDALHGRVGISLVTISCLVPLPGAAGPWIEY